MFLSLSFPSLSSCHNLSLNKHETRTKLMYLYGTACLILLLFRRGICHKSHDPGLFKIFLGLGKNIKNQCINFPSLLNLSNLDLRRWSFSQKLESSVCLPLSRKTDNLLKYMSKKYSIFQILAKNITIYSIFSGKIKIIGILARLKNLTE